MEIIDLGSPIGDTNGGIVDALCPATQTL